MDDFIKTIGLEDEVDIVSSGEDSEGEVGGRVVGLVSDEEVEEAAVLSDSGDDDDSEADLEGDSTDDGFEFDPAGAGAGASSSSDESDGEESSGSEEEDEEEEEEEVAAKPGLKKKDKKKAKVEAPTTRTKPIAIKTAREKKVKVAVAAAAPELAPLSKVVDADHTFAGLHLSRPLLRAVADMNYSTPTAIQYKAIPVALTGQDVCGSAQTGSGKTAAFLLPALERLLHRDKRAPAIRVLVILPTRELASQCHAVCEKLCKFTDIRSALVVGGLSLQVQEAALRKRPDVVIGTPGRLLDHAHNSLNVHFDHVDILVLDEADRLLEMGFTEEVQEVVKACPVERQTLFFSATMTSKVEELAKYTLKKPVRVSADPMFDVADRLTQEFVRVRKAKEREREAMLVTLLTSVFEKEVLVFFQTKVQAHRMMILLQLMGVRVGELHGNLTQQQRLDAYSDFAARRIDILVATDLAARGLDIDCCKTVINYEMPRDLTTYVHRVGRTARAGRKGHAVTLTGEDRRALMKDIVKHAQGAVKSRTIDPAAIAKWQQKLRELQPEYYDRLKMERIEKEARLGEMEAVKARNLLQHAGDIAARPAREWFQSATQKAKLKEATKAAAEATEHDLSAMTAKERKALRNSQRKQEKKATKEAEKKAGSRMNRKKRRRAAVLADSAEAFAAQKGMVRKMKKEAMAKKRRR